MHKIHELLDTLRKRASGLKEAANECTSAAGRFALQVRADEARRCAEALEKVLKDVEAPTAKDAAR